jgi:subtilisin family serine protease
MKKTKLLIILLITAIVLATLSLGYLFVTSDTSDSEEEIAELDSVYISDTADTVQLQIDTETKTETQEDINPDKSGELSIDENRKVITFNKDLSEEEKEQIESEYSVEFTEDQAVKGTYTIITSNESNLEKLEQNEDVDTVETDIPVKMFTDTIDWGVKRVGADSSWDSGTGNGVIVAVVDTGIQLNHPDLSTNVITGYDFVNNDESATDDNGHGTHVAGIIASTMNGSGNVGTSYSAKLMPVKVLNESGYGYLSDVAKGIYYAADNGARIINMSLGTSEDSDTLRTAVQYAANKGVLLVAAAGNDSGAPCAYPAAYSSVVCVVATDQDNKLASFSNIGGELAAPGVSNYSTYINSAYATLSGTSMASPHVAGSAALLLSVCTDCSTSEVRTLLRETATDLGSVGNDIIFGYGLVNLIEATETLQPDEEQDQDEQIPEETPLQEPEEEEEDTTNEDDNNLQDDDQNENDVMKDIVDRRPSKEPVTLEITSPFTTPSKRYIVREKEDIELKFEISPQDTDVEEYAIYLNNEKIEDYEGQDTSYTFDIEDLKNIQYILTVKAKLSDTTVSDSILLDLTHLSRERFSFKEKSVMGVSDFRSWFSRLVF